MDSVTNEAVLLATGALFGALHVLTGPDHLVAVLPIGLDARARGWWVGLQWGVGHALGITAVGFLAYGLQGWLDLDILSFGGEWLTAAVLIGIGAWGLAHRGVLAASSELEASSDGEHLGAHVHTAMAFGVGAVHGVAGTGALLGVIPVLSLEAWSRVVAYLLGFGVGTVLAMLAFGAVVGAVAWRATSDARWIRLYRGAFLGACWVAIGVGVGLAWSAASGWL